jgi:hypothetical protein
MSGELKSDVKIYMLFPWQVAFIAVPRKKEKRKKAAIVVALPCN